MRLHIDKLATNHNTQGLNFVYNLISQLPSALLNLKLLRYLKLYGNPLSPPFDTLKIGSGEHFSGKEEMTNVWDDVRSILLQQHQVPTVAPPAPKEAQKPKNNTELIVGLAQLKIRKCLENHETQLGLDTSDEIGEIEELPQTIFKLQRLRSLRLFGARELKSISQEISNLSNLQILVISGSPFLGCIPAGIFEIPKLKVCEFVLFLLLYGDLLLSST